MYHSHWMIANWPQRTRTHGGTRNTFQHTRFCFKGLLELYIKPSSIIYTSLACKAMTHCRPYLLHVKHLSRLRNKMGRAKISFTKHLTWSTTHAQNEYLCSCTSSVSVNGASCTYNSSVNWKQQFPLRVCKVSACTSSNFCALILHS